MASKMTNGSDRKSTLRLDLLAWGVLGLIAAAYLVVLVMRPDVMGKLHRLIPAEQESNHGTRNLSKALAELKSLNQKARKLRHDIARLRSIKASDQVWQISCG